MKVTYTCDVCGKAYESEKEAKACEKSHETANKREELRQKSLKVINDLFNKHVETFLEFPEIQLDDEMIDKMTDDQAQQLLGSLLKGILE